jgi:hypothetical protein
MIFEKFLHRVTVKKVNPGIVTPDLHRPRISEAIYRALIRSAGVSG